MKPSVRQDKGPLIVTLFTVVAGLAIYHLSFGIETLNPTNIDWLMIARHDWGTHYLGWAFYRNEPWTFPLGTVQNYYYPVGTNIGFTDSIPLVAMLLKPFSGLLPDEFQYFGLWMIGCVVATGIYTILILRKFGAGNTVLAIASVFIMANPVLIYRGFHHALCAHWILLAGTYCYITAGRDQKPGALRHQFIILIISAAVNPYLCLMSLGFSFFISLRQFVEKTIKLGVFIKYNLISVLGVIAIWFVTGLITLKSEETLAVSSAYGLYSLNLNALYNPGGFSKFLPQFPWVSWHQYEGFMYPGLGMIVLFAVSGLSIAVFAIAGRMHPVGWIKSHSKSVMLLFIFSVIITVFSVTNIVSLDDKVLFSLSFPRQIIKLGDIFRASARFFWVTYYFLLILSFFLLIRLKIKENFKIVFLVLLLILQLEDVWKIIRSRQSFRARYMPPIDYAGWKGIMKDFDKVMMYPPFEGTYVNPGDYQDFSNLAAQLGKPITVGYVARGNGSKANAFVESVAEGLMQNKIDDTALYITDLKHVNDFGFLLKTGSAQVYFKDQYFYLYSASRKGTDSKAANRQLDSVRSAYSSWPEIRKISTVIPFNDKIVHSFSRFQTSDKGILMSGWAFDVSKETTLEDSVLVLLKSSTASYLVTPDRVSFPDLNLYSRRTDVASSGFSLIIGNNLIPKGAYDVNIVIKTRDGKLSSAVTDRFFVVDSDSPAVKKLSRREISDAVVVMDLLDKEENGYSFRGWAVLKDVNAVGNKISIVLRKGDDSYLFPANQFFRPDVTSFYGNTINYDNSGYKLRINRTALPPGNYKVGVYIKNSLTVDEGLFMTDQTIEF